MSYLAERQNVLARNIANADTPHFRAQDLRPFSFESALLRGAGGTAPLRLASTNPAHVGGERNGAALQADQATSYGEEPNGNTVTLEEQMVKQADVAKSYDMATTVYRRSAALLRAAVGSR